MRLQPGDLVEAWLRDPRIPSWQPARIFTVSTDASYEVEYDELLADSGTERLIERLPAALVRPRVPCAFEEPFLALPWSNGLLVDVFQEDSWWEAVLLEPVPVLRRNSTVLIRHLSDNLEDERVSLQTLRASRTWDAAVGTWCPKRDTTKGTPSLPTPEHPDIQKKTVAEDPSTLAIEALPQEKNTRMPRAPEEKTTAKEPSTLAIPALPEEKSMRTSKDLKALLDSGVLEPGETLSCKINGNVLKSGAVQPSGIDCNCCRKLFSPSGFQKHAASRTQHPYRCIFYKQGRSLDEMRSSSPNEDVSAEVDGGGEFDPNDDNCAFCLERGELLCCDSCPASFHLACIGLKSVPEGDWFCHACRCRVCSRGPPTNTCAQCKLKYHSRCVGLAKAPGDPRWFCGNACKEIFAGLQCFVGVKIELANGLSWTLSNRTAARKLAMAESTHGVEPHIATAISRSNCQFYAALLENAQQIVISAAHMRVHGCYAAEIRFVAGTGEGEASRILLAALEELLRSLKVQQVVLFSRQPNSMQSFQPVEEVVRQYLLDLGVVPPADTELLAKKL